MWVCLGGRGGTDGECRSVAGPRCNGGLLQTRAHRGVPQEAAQCTAAMVEIKMGYREKRRGSKEWHEQKDGTKTRCATTPDRRRLTNNKKTSGAPGGDGGSPAYKTGQHGETGSSQGPNRVEANPADGIAHRFGHRVGHAARPFQPQSGPSLRKKFPSEGSAGVGHDLAIERESRFDGNVAALIRSLVSPIHDPFLHPKGSMSRKPCASARATAGPLRRLQNDYG
jgi:hypothetical protein